MQFKGASLLLKKIGRGILYTAGGLFLVEFTFFLWLAFFSGPSVVPLLSNSVLTITLSGEYREYLEEDNLSRLFMPDIHSFYHLIKALDAARHEPDIVAVLLRIDANTLGSGMAHQLHCALQKVRQAGKPVYVYSDTFGEAGSALKDYYIASASDQIWMQPLGEVHFKALGITLPFLRRLLSTIGIESQVLKRYEYKSFPDMYNESSLDAKNREATLSLLNSLEDVALHTISECRNIPQEKLKQLLAVGPFDDKEGIQHGLIDKLGTLTEIREALEEKFGKDVHAIAYQDFLDNFEDKKAATAPRVALFFASGEIARDTGEHTDHTDPSELVIRSHRLAHNIIKAAQKEDVKAIVLRIDSPGGDALASETIHLALRHAREKGKKPIVISMGDAAASGGYWIATAGDLIFAHPGTLTGSIGVFGGKFVIQKLSEMIGVTWEGVATQENALEDSMTRPYSPQGLRFLNRALDRTYWEFIDRVATARKLSKDEAHALAKGRVWTGQQAYDHHLVDRLGTLEDAILAAISLAKTDPNTTVVDVYPRARKIGEVLKDVFFGRSHGIEPLIKMATRLFIKHAGIQMLHTVQPEGTAAKSLRAPLDSKTIQ